MTMVPAVGIHLPIDAGISKNCALSHPAMKHLLLD
jgi:hypothetical protein